MSLKSFFKRKWYLDIDFCSWWFLFLLSTQKNANNKLTYTTHFQSQFSSRGKITQTRYSFCQPCRQFYWIFQKRGSLGNRMKKPSLCLIIFKLILSWYSTFVFSSCLKSFLNWDHNIKNKQTDKITNIASWIHSSILVSVSEA